MRRFRPAVRASREPSATTPTRPGHPRRLRIKIISSSPPWPISEAARLGRILKHWRQGPLLLRNPHASDRGTDALSGLIELHERIAATFRNPTTIAYECCSLPADSHPGLLNATSA